MSSANLPIFCDPKGRRWQCLRGAGFSAVVLITLLAAVFIASVIINPVLPTLNLRPASALPQPADTRLHTPPLVITRKEQQALLAQQTLRREIARTMVVPARPPSQIKVAAPINAPVPTIPTHAAGNRSQDKTLSIGFYVNWDDSSYSSLKRNLQQLDWLVPEWVRLGDPNANNGDPLVRDIDPKALDLIRRERPQMPILPLVQNYKDEQWNSDLLAHAVGDEPSRQSLVSDLVRVVDENKFGGVTIDLEEVPSGSQANLLRFMTELHAAFLQRGFLVAQAVPFDNPEWNYQAYAAVTDYLMLMGYDEHSQTSQPGSIAGQNWFEQTLAKRMRELDPAKTILCVGSYGYNWTDGNNEAEDITFQEAVLAARDSDARIEFEPMSRNPHFSYDEEDGSHHTVWFLDAATAYNEMRAAASYHPAGYALWRLGSEDPSLWQVFGSNTANAATDLLRQIRYGYDIDFEGTGEILQVTSEPQDGAREVSTDADNFITNETYTQIPSSYVITRAGDHPGLVALTFDDGPDPEWTPRILDVLKREGVPASFFIIGENGQANPELVKRIVREGHDIGNHTFTHPSTLR